MGANCVYETFTSGDFTSIFNFLHSFISVTTLSIVDISLVKLADINSAA